MEITSRESVFIVHFHSPAVSLVFDITLSVKIDTACSWPGYKLFKKCLQKFTRDLRKHFSISGLLDMRRQGRTSCSLVTRCGRLYGLKARTDFWAFSSPLKFGQCIGRRLFELNGIGMGSEEGGLGN